MELEYRNKKWLQEQFKKYKTVTKIAKETGYPRTCITRYAKKFNIYSSKYTREQKNFLNENFFEKIDSEEKAYWLGFIMADGNIHRRKNNNGLQFSIKIKNDDINHLKKFKKAINFSGKISCRSSIRKNVETKSCEIKIYNRKFCQDLINNNIIPNKTGKENIPNTINKKFYKDFIRGFFDGDGTITGSIEKGKILKVSTCSTSLIIINQIKEYIYNELNILMHTNLYNNIYTLSCTKKEDNYKLLNYLYYDKCVALDRKYNLALLSMLQYEKIYK